MNGNYEKPWQVPQLLHVNQSNIEKKFKEIPQYPSPHKTQKKIKN